MAGRPKGTLGDAAKKGRAFALKILKEEKFLERWREQLVQEDGKLRQTALIYLTNRAFGTPIQIETVEGNVTVSHSVTSADRAKATAVLKKLELPLEITSQSEVVN